MYRKLFTGLMSLVFLSGCYYDSEEELYGTCNTSNVSYSQNITNILQNNLCMNCHGNPPSNAAPFSLVTYADVKAQVDAGRLIGAINHIQGFAAMPKEGPKMSQCDIDKVEAWVASGAPQN